MEYSRASTEHSHCQGLDAGSHASQGKAGSGWVIERSSGD